MDSALIDVRSNQEFEQGHLRGSISVELAELPLRMHELPPRSLPVTLICTPDQLQHATDVFSAKGYEIARLELWQTETIAQWHSQGLIESGPQAARLWEPAPVIRTFVERFMPNTPEPASNLGLDIACGCGRESVFLAMHGWQMTGIDYQQTALEKAQRLAKQHIVNLKTLSLDVEADDTALSNLPGMDLICVQRYLHRPLLPKLQQQLNPGGYLIYQTFMQGCEAFGRPRNPNFLLVPGELKATFDALDVLYDEVITLDDGRPTNGFIARKPLSPIA
ncbi:Uncharacterised protein [BD1-7 clade bacterium]|nr:Uncharacterised protein [BD1-7 clade bacterium]